MLSISPAKILVILVVALLVLGPDKLPGVARQIGAAWHDLRKLRTRLETEVRGAFPDLPSPQQVAQAVRSPLSYLDGLADKHAAGLAEGDGAAAGAAGTNGSAGNGSGAGPPAGAATDSVGHDGRSPGNGAAAGAGTAPAGWADGLGELADDPSMN